VVGLGPGDARHVTAAATTALREAAVARLRTRVHPGAAAFDVESYDQWYESADSFEELYARIVEDLVALARTSPSGEVVYAVPGSPMVAERTVELLRAREDVDLVCEPAVSVIDVACAALGVDPMARGLRVLDALDAIEPLRGPGPLLILQAYAPAVLATVADRLPGDTPVDVLHHLGLADERIVRLRARELASFRDADHLTSLYVDGLRTAGEAMDDLVSFTRRLRAQCPWDQDQTHASLTKYLVEEVYEAFDALTNLAVMIDAGVEDEAVVAHAEEELGDVLFQVLFHAELGDEEGRFTLATIADAVRDKLTGRHPHVFADVVLTNADEVAARWEVLKKAEKGRTSVLDGVSWFAPALSLHAKVLRNVVALSMTDDASGESPRRGTASELLDVARDAREEVERLRCLVASIEWAPARDDDAARAARAELLAAALASLNALATFEHLDLESLLRARVLDLRDQILAIEAAHPERARGGE
jgi:tetrapyrrole methylase family protein/MazG family protein